VIAITAGASGRLLIGSSEPQRLKAAYSAGSSGTAEEAAEKPPALEVLKGHGFLAVP